MLIKNLAILQMDTGFLVELNVFLLQATLGLRHQTVNHSLHFVGPVTGAHPRNCGNVELVQTNDARKELLTTIQAIVKHFKERMDGRMTSKGYSAPEKKLITEEILAACATEKHPTALVRKAIKKYFVTQKRGFGLVKGHKLHDAQLAEAKKASEKASHGSPA
ncbi:hypothetical protein EMCRGX_G003486 [Ephydatia muelleri]|eukprot:Em0001g3323a